MQPDNVIPFEQTESESGFFSPLMKSELVEKAAKIIPDPQILINVISKRVRHLNGGRSPVVDVRPGMGAADIALTELIEGKIKISEPAKKPAKKKK